MSQVTVAKKGGTKEDHKLVWNADKKIYEVFPKVDESEIYWNNRKQVNLKY